MITKNDDGSVLIVVDKIQLKLNPNPLTNIEDDRIRAILSTMQIEVKVDNKIIIRPYTQDEINQEVQREIKSRNVHAQILQLDELEIIQDMIEADPNGWFITYCDSKGISYA